jgi:bacterial/archaeal transporter family protein
MWIIYALGSALFAGITTILAKAGIKETSSNVATAVRTVVVLLFAWLMVLIVGSQDTIPSVSGKTLIFLVLSGLATGASWLCYFRALQLGNVNKVVPVDKSSIVLTVLLAIIFLGETGSLGVRLPGIATIGVGTYLMIQKRPGETRTVVGSKWLVYAAFSAVFASLTSILGKVGISDVESNLGTAIRTIVVLVMAWIVVFVTKEQHRVKDIPRRDLLFICLSGVATGASWLCFYKALQDGPASLVVPIDKLSILVTVAVAYFAFKERLTRKALVGLILIVVGTLVMLA